MILPPLPKLVDLRRPRDLLDLASRVYEWGTGVQDLLRAMRPLVTQILDGTVSGSGGGASISFGTPGAIQPDDAAAEGVASTAARSDHKHSIVAAVAGAATPGDSAAEGVATSFARSDHKHSLAAFGTTAGTFCQGNDSRLSDSRAPTAHHTSHEAGGSDKIKLDDLEPPDDNTDLNASTTAHGLLKKLSGNVSDVLRGDGTFGTVGGGFTAAYYRGYSTSSATWSSTTWSDLHNIITWTDDASSNISRSNSTFTVTDAGLYVVSVVLGAYNSAGNDYMSVRVREGSTTRALTQVYSESGSARTACVAINTVISLAAGASVTLQYAVSATWNAFGPITIDSEAGRSVGLSIYRIS